MATCLDGERYAPLSITPMPEAFYWPDKTTEHSRLSRFGMTSEPLMESLGEELLTWFREVSPAKTSAAPEKELVLPDQGVDCGQKWPESFAKYDPVTSTWKIPQCSLPEGLDEYSKTWPKWGLMRNGECWELQTVVPHINVNVSGFWATPTTMDSLPPKSPEALQREATIARPGRKKPANLRDQVSNMQNWPTPTVNDSKNSTLPPSQLNRDNIPGALLRTGEQPGGLLNPAWVEWLIGWPIGWTDLKPLETGRFQEWQQQHLIC